MKKSNIGKRIFALLLTMVLLLSIVGCKSDNKEETESNPSSTEKKQDEGEKGNEPEREEITLRILWPENFDAPGIQDTPIANVIREKLGIKLDIIGEDGGKTKQKLALASGDLPDIVMSSFNTLEQIMEGGHAIPLNGLLESHGENVKNDFNVAMDVVNGKLGNTDGNYYFVPPKVNNNPGLSLLQRPWIGYMARWDYYAELGYPKMDTVDDFLDVLKQMQDKHPKTADGKKVYALAGWSDWGLWAYHVPFMYTTGWLETGSLVFTPENDLTARFAADGPYWGGVELFYKANRMGLVDPDSYIMKYENMIAKAKAGQLLTVPAGWVADEVNASIAELEGEGKGFEYIPAGFTYSTAHQVTQSPAGYVGDFMWITNDCKYPERAMELINFVCSYEGSRLIHSGIEDEHWDMEDGKPEWKDSTFEAKKSNPDFINNTGIGLYAVMAGYDIHAIAPDGGKISLKDSNKGLVKGVNQLDKAFSDYYNVSFPGEIWDKMLQEGKTKFISVENTFIGQFSSGETDDILKIKNNVEEYLKKNYPKLIMAKTDEDFEAEKQKQIKAINDMGMDQYLEWSKEQYEIAKKKAQDYGVIK